MSSTKALRSEPDDTELLLRDGELVFVVCCWYLMASADLGGSDGAEVCFGDFW